MPRELINEPDYKVVSKNIRVQMAEAEMSKKKVAAKTMINYATLCQKLSRTTDHFTLRELVKIAKVLNVPISILLDGLDEIGDSSI